jgi:hypothetical protein
MGSLLSAQEPTIPVRPLQAMRTVYLLPMSSGFDQYLANQLTRQNVFEVVLDPALADSVLTGQLGKPFEDKLKELYPAPEPEPAKKEGEETDETAEAERESPPAFQQGSSFVRGRGNVFLVDPRSQRVLWSTYLLPKNSTPAELDKAARNVVKRLIEDLKKAGLPGG